MAAHGDKLSEIEADLSFGEVVDSNPVFYSNSSGAVLPQPDVVESTHFHPLRLSFGSYRAMTT